MYLELALSASSSFPVVEERLVSFINRGASEKPEIPTLDGIAIIAYRAIYVLRRLGAATTTVVESSLWRARFPRGPAAWPLRRRRAVRIYTPYALDARSDYSSFDAQMFFYYFSPNSWIIIMFVRTYASNVTTTPLQVVVGFCKFSV